LDFAHVVPFPFCGLIGGCGAVEKRQEQGAANWKLWTLKICEKKGGT